MHYNRHMNRKGFTLIEILLVVLFVAVLGTVAVSTYMNSTKNFTFLSGFKNVMSVVRTARSYAITNNDIGGVKPPRYGVYLNSKCVLLFADWGDDAFKLELPSGDSGCATPTSSTPTKYDEIVKQFSLADSPFELDFLNSQASPVTVSARVPVPPTTGTSFTPPLQLFYDITSGKVTLMDSNGDVIDKREEKYVAIRLHEGTTNGTQKFIVLFQISGLPEQFDEISSL